MTSQSQLPRFPPRKARTSPRLIKFIVQFFTRLKPMKIVLPARGVYSLSSIYKLLILVGLTRTSISLQARSLRERLSCFPAGETVLR
ncbi:MAG: hypothetical protein ACFFDI_24545 [Promethearchaeota archaeon]